MSAFTAARWAPTVRADSLSEDEISRLAAIIDRRYMIEGQLRWARGREWALEAMQARGEDVQERLSHVRAEIAELEAERAATEERRDDLENDPWTIEKVAREEYGMMRDGETCYRVESQSEANSKKRSASWNLFLAARASPFLY